MFIFMRKVRLFMVALATVFSAFSMNAQSITETFDSNSLEWNENASKNGAGTAIIDKGVLTIESNGVNKWLSAMVGSQVGNNTYFTCFCYAPLNVQRPFTVKSKVNIQKLDDDRIAGLVFNYKDDGTFYTIAFNETGVNFLRYVDNKLVGTITQSVKWKKKKKMQQTWILQSDGSTLTFLVDDEPIMKVRYMPLEYAGFGYYTYGKQKLVVDEVEFIQ